MSALNCPIIWVSLFNGSDSGGPPTGSTGALSRGVDLEGLVVCICAMAGSAIPELVLCDGNIRIHNQSKMIMMMIISPGQGLKNCLVSMDVDILWQNFGPAPVVGQTGRAHTRI